jgi:membrane complex biogenesis BtpA family protein
MDHIEDMAARDLDILQGCGIDGVMFVNEHDFPYSKSVGVEVVAAAAAVIGRLKANICVPFGVDLLWDSKATLAVARATGASFVRGVYSGVYGSEMGLLERDWGELCGYRHFIDGDEIAVFTNITPEFAGPMSNRTLEQRARDAAEVGFDALLVSGGYVGAMPDLDQIQVAKNVSRLPVLAITGVVEQNIERVYEVADAAIVGSAMRVDCSIWNPVDEERVRRMVAIVKNLQAHKRQTGPA